MLITNKILHEELILDKATLLFNTSSLSLRKSNNTYKIIHCTKYIIINNLRLKPHNVKNGWVKLF